MDVRSVSGIVISMPSIGKTAFSQVTLPPPCGDCQPFGGSWVSDGNGSRRCRCERGRALYKMDMERKAADREKARKVAARRAKRNMQPSPAPAEEKNWWD